MSGDREIYDDNIWNSFPSKYTAQYLDKYIIIPTQYFSMSVRNSSFIQDPYKHIISMYIFSKWSLCKENILIKRGFSVFSTHHLFSFR